MEAPRARALILVADDRRRWRVREALERDGHEIISTGSGRRAAELLKDWRRAPDVVVLDMGLPSAEGAAFASAYRRAPGQHPPLILVPAPEQTDQPVRLQLVEEDGETFGEAFGAPEDLAENGLSSAALDLLRARVRMHGTQLAERRRNGRWRPSSVIAAGAGVAAALAVGVAAAAPAWAGGF